ncbi:unnamed protein product [Durusdinium trenchii]|uniref:Uncharacterized protein n=1 Tax=Durusdinium trenchii TaxID=1381693 RepID=A0ABP0RX34_9DINO
MPALRSDKADEDSRLFIERLLLPPGTTCSRVVLLYAVLLRVDQLVYCGRPSDLPRRSRRFGGWSPFPGSDVGRPCLSRKTGIQVSFTAPVYAEDGYLSPPTNSCSEQSEARLAERSEMPS